MLEIGFPNKDEVKKYIKIHIKASDDLTYAWKMVHDAWKYHEDEIFRSEGSHINEKWDKLSPAYKKIKPKGLPKLVLTGKMKKSVVTGKSNAKVEYKKDYMKHYTTVPYAMFHQFGTKKMPMRKFIGINKDMFFDMTQAFHRAFNKYVRRVRPKVKTVK